MNEHRPQSFFVGNELPRMLALLVVALVGWVLVWYFLIRDPARVNEPDLVVNGTPEPVVADASVEFETVTDKTVVGFRDSAAINKLLIQARELSPEALAAKSRRDVTFAHLFERPAHYRGVPIHLLGAALRIVRYESKYSKTGWLYEAWVTSPDSQRDKWVCLFEDPPQGLRIGQNVSERVVFNGYFLKLMRYEAADVPRGAPLLVGKIGWTPNASATPGSPNRSAYWLASIVAVMFTVSLVRWIVQLRRSLRPRASDAIRFNLPSEEIAPESLSAFLENLGSEDDGDAPIEEDAH